MLGEAVKSLLRGTAQVYLILTSGKQDRQVTDCSVTFLAVLP